ncbi:hypothetical protein [Singulisphaera sp. PoT]|uniref:hypothetical protein n=1 Tax=Singulisphaera sp. PoT TaxID=3411797 RepID=UPI003BF4B2DB
MAIVGLGMTLALGAIAPGALAAPKTGGMRSSQPRLIYHKSRSFRVPFNVDHEDQARLKEVQLWYSEDKGDSWKQGPTATPDRPSFTFKAPRDAEYWFTVRTLDIKGKLYPGDDDEVEPKMKVVVDSTPPILRLDSHGRKGTKASVRWEVKDRNLDQSTLVIEYQPEGIHEWRRIPKVNFALLGSVEWDAGTAEALHVRASISDRAGNTTEENVDLPEGSSSNPGVITNDLAGGEPPPISQISSSSSFPPVEENPAPAERQQDPFPPAAEAQPANVAGGAGDAGQDAFGDPGSSEGGAPDAGGAPAGNGGSRSLLVSSPRFPLAYDVEDAGPNGPSSVELWVTQDRGRTWTLQGKDPDRSTPFPVDLGGEGTFGLCLVARSASGLGDNPPQPGDPPQFWVEVDQTPPAVELIRTQVGTGKHMGKIAIYWRATDIHLRAKPVQIAWRADQQGSRWNVVTTQGPIENTGSFVWTVPANVPPKFHLRIEAVDDAGNRGVAETSESAPVIVDRTRPKSRILGLHPSANAAGNQPRSTR